MCASVCVCGCVGVCVCVCVCGCVCNSHFFKKTSICLAFLSKGLSLFHSFIQYGKNVFLKIFDLKGMGFILVVDADLKG